MSDHSVSNKRIAKNSIFLSVRMVIVMCISLYTSRVILQTLGVEDYGVYNVVGGFVSMFAFLNTSMSNGIQRFYNYELGKNGEDAACMVYRTSLFIQFALGIVIVLLTETVGLWYLHNIMVIPGERMFAAEWIFQISIISFLIIILQVPYTAAVMAHEKMDFYAIVSVLDAVLKLLLVLLLPHIGYDRLIIFGIITLLLHLVDFLLYYFYCKLKFKEITLKRGTARINRSLFGLMLGFSGWNVFGSFSNIMRDQGINLIINLFYGPIVNAARGVAMQVNGAVTNLVSSILTPVRPQVIQSYARNEMDRSMNLTYSISKFSIFFLMLLALPICVEVYPILHIWLGVVPDHSPAFCIIILATSAILVPTGALATLVHASGDMMKYQVIGGTVKLLAVPLAFIMLKLGYAPEWALIMVLVFDVVGLVVGMFIIKTIMPFSISIYLKRVVIPIIPVFLISLTIELLLKSFIANQVLSVFMVLIIGTVVSISTFYVIGVSKDEKKLLNSMIRSVLNKE